MALDDPPTDREPQAGAAVVLAGGPLEALEDAFPLWRGDPDPVVPDLHARPAVGRRLGLDNDARDGARCDVLQGVADQVVEHLPQQDPVGPHVEQVSGDDLATCPGMVEGGDDVLDLVAQGDHLEVQRLVASHRVGEQAGDEASHLVDAHADVLDHRRGTCSLGRVAVRELVLERLRPAVDHAERVVQVVCDRPRERGQGLTVAARGGHVADDDHRPVRGTIGVWHRERRDLEHPGDAVLVDVVHFLGVDVLAGHGSVVGVVRVLERPPVRVEGLALALVLFGDTFQRLCGTSAERGDQCLVRVYDAPARLDDRDAVVESRHHHVQLFGTHRKGRLGVLQPRDGVDDLATRQGNGHAGHHQHDHEDLRCHGSGLRVAESGDRAVALDRQQDHERTREEALGRGDEGVEPQPGPHRRDRQDEGGWEGGVPPEPEHAHHQDHEGNARTVCPLGSGGSHDHRLASVPVLGDPAPRGAVRRTRWSPWRRRCAPSARAGARSPRWA